MKRIVILLAVAALAVLPALAEQPGGGADNLLLDISGRLVQALAPGNVDQTQVQNEVIAGTPVVARSHIQAKSQAALVPDASNWVIDVTLRGTSLAAAVATPTDQDVIAYLHSITTFTLTKRIYCNAAGLGSYPAKASAVATVKLEKMTTTAGTTDTLLTNLAEDVFEGRKDQFERTLAQKSETDLDAEVDRQFAPLLTQANQAYRDGIAQINAAGIPLRRLSFSTSSNFLSLGARIALADTGMSPAPALVGPVDLGVRVHQSAINDGAQSALAGKTFSASALDSKMMLSGEPLGEATLTFADHAPLIVVFADHGFVLTVKVKELHAMGVRLPGLTVKAVYKLMSIHGRCEAVRQGPVQISPYYGHKIGSQVLGVLLEHRLNATFKHRIAIPNLEAPASLSQIGTLVPVSADAADGWLAIGWIRQSPPRK